VPATPTTQILPLTLAGPSYSTRSKEVSMQETVNWYPEVSGTGGEKSITLYPTPGTTFKTEMGGGKHRGRIEFNGNAFFVVGDTLYKMDELETVSAIGTINTASGRVVMASNGTQGNQMMFVDGTDGWIYDSSVETLTRITDAQFPSNPNIVVFMDTYFIVIPDNSALFYISNSNDGTGWEGLDFASAERDPDIIVTAEVVDRELLLVGRDTTEVWANTGGEFPFEAYGNGLISIGCAAKYSIASTIGASIFLARNKQGTDRVVMIKGVGFQPISNKGLEYQLSTYSKVDDAYAEIYNQAGHLFYVLTFPTEGKTWVYDFDIADPDHAWHERSSNDGAWFMSTILFFNDKLYAGHKDNSRLYTLDLDVYKEGTDTIKRSRTGTHIKKFNNRLRYTGQGSSPKIMVEWSTDYGHTFDNKRYLDGPAIGEYFKRIQTHQLGSHRDLVIRISVSDPINWVIKGAFLHVQELSN